MLHRNNTQKIESILRSQAKFCGIKIYHFVNVGNHLHLVIKLSNRSSFNPFIRAITGLIARHVLKAERGSAKAVQFWVARPFTRIICWGKDYLNISRYMNKNRAQAKTTQSNVFSNLQLNHIYSKNHFIAWGFDLLDVGKIIKLSTG